MSVYQDYTVLAFRYTATIKNVFQDLLWAIQVDFISYRPKMKTLAKDAKSKSRWITCGTPLDQMSSQDWEKMLIQENLLLLASVSVEPSHVWVMSILLRLKFSMMSKLSLSELPELVTENGLIGLITSHPALHIGDTSLQETQLPSYLVVWVHFATTNRQASQSDATRVIKLALLEIEQVNKNKLKKIKLPNSSMKLNLFLNISLKMTIMLTPLLTTSMDTKRSTTIPLYNDLELIQHLLFNYIKKLTMFIDANI